ncbi:MAG TPA: hypothetical protein C5S51_09785 [Methanosarcinaceae archaeon]|nr:hypothetical protein [Methanosarcinaceae archaeon]
MRELQNVTDYELQEARELIRKYPQFLLVMSDVRRPEIQRDFVALVEDAYRDVHDADISVWLSNFVCTNASVMSTTQCRGTEGVKTDAKNDATAQKRGTFLHHERETQNGF